MRHPPIRQERIRALATQSNPSKSIYDRQNCTAAEGVSEAELARCRAEIAKLLPLWPRELSDMSPAGRAHIIASIERALRAERRRGLAGHWTYNLARHVQLLRAHRAETAAARTRRKPHLQRTPQSTDKF